MPDLPKHKVGLVSCSGEELPEGTLARIATRLVLEKLRPNDTVTICLPLFLAGGAGERAFARMHPTITIDGCSRLCARRGTEAHSGRVAASVVVTDFVRQSGAQSPMHRRNLDDGERHLATVLAEEIAGHVDRLLGMNSEQETHTQAAPAACACQGGTLPARKVDTVHGPVEIVALDPILAQFAQARRAADQTTERDLLEMVKIYNYVPPESETEIAAAVLREYAASLAQ